MATARYLYVFQLKEQYSTSKKRWKEQLSCFTVKVHLEFPQVTDKDGKFKLTMYYPNDGAIVGNHKNYRGKARYVESSTGEMNAADPGERTPAR